MAAHTVAEIMERDAPSITEGGVFGRAVLEQQPRGWQPLVQLLPALIACVVLERLKNEP